MIRVAAILIENNQIALIKRQNQNGTYFVFPGGHLESNEDPVNALIREINEELGINIKVTKLVIKFIRPYSEEYYYLIKFRGGVFGTGNGSEFLSQEETYEPLWVNLGDLSSLNLLPLLIKDKIIECLSNDWPECCLVLK
jgi:8-oxo-dGTP pyrophosphatase MutT (NUDIX family)